MQIGGDKTNDYEQQRSHKGGTCGEAVALLGDLNRIQLGALDIEPKSDPVQQPAHYTSHPSGVECITIAQHFVFNLGNAIKYVWRAGLKSDDKIQDLRKAIQYLEFEIVRLGGTVEVKRKPIYFAHKLRGATIEETQANRREASRLVAKYVNEAEARGEPIAPVCAWIHLAEVWTEEEGRALGLVIDCALIEMVAACGGELWLIGVDPKTSQGMQIEIDRAREVGCPVIDLRGGSV